MFNILWWQPKHHVLSDPNTTNEQLHQLSEHCCALRYTSYWLLANKGVKPVLGLYSLGKSISKTLNTQTVSVIKRAWDHPSNSLCCGGSKVYRKPLLNALYTSVSPKKNVGHVTCKVLFFRSDGENSDQIFSMFIALKNNWQAGYIKINIIKACRFILFLLRLLATGREAKTIKSMHVKFNLNLKCRSELKEARFPFARPRK